MLFPRERFTKNAFRRLSKTAQKHLFGRSTAGHYIFYNQSGHLSSENGASFKKGENFPVSRLDKGHTFRYNEER